MKIYRNVAMGLMATIVYFAIIIGILSQLFEPLNSFMDGETGHFWRDVVIYILTLSLAVSIPNYVFYEVILNVADKGKRNDWFMAVIFLVFAFISYPLLAHSITTISQSGLNPVQFKESVSAMLDFKNSETSWHVIWYGLAFFVYGGTATIVLVFGLAIGVPAAILWGWGKVIELVIDFPEKENDH